MFTTDIHFESDIEKIIPYLKRDCQLTAGKLFTDFLEFYSARYKPDSHVISISDEVPF